MSIVFPLSKITPLFTLLIGVFYLKEEITLLAFIGIILIVAGVYGMHLKNFQVKGILKPIISLKNKGSILALLAAIASAIHGLYSKLALNEINPFVFIYVGYVFLILFYTPLLYFKKQTIKEQVKKFKFPIIKIGLLDFGNYLLTVIALSLSKLSYIFALRQINILFAVLIGVYILKEKRSKAKIISSIIMTIGIILLSMS